MKLLVRMLLSLVAIMIAATVFAAGIEELAWSSGEKLNIFYTICTIIFGMTAILAITMSFFTFGKFMEPIFKMVSVLYVVIGITRNFSEEGLVQMKLTLTVAFCIYILLALLLIRSNLRLASR